MKLQSLLVIFIIIALPVILILSAYVSYQVDTARLKTEYTDVLLGATHDCAVAFQLNSTNNKYSTVSDSLIRDLEGAITTFSTSFSTHLGLTGASRSYAMSYIPALVFTLYDGYYIYTPTANENGAYEHSLKPYVYYTKEYINGGDTKIIINFSIDNYVAVYYYDDSSNTYQSRAGYLEVIANTRSQNGIYKNGDTIYYNRVEIPRYETLSEDSYSATKTGDYVTNWSIYSNINNNDESAYNYYKEAWEFTNWYNNLIKTKLSNTDQEKLYINSDNLPYPNEASRFNDERYEVIKSSINNNLIQAMNAFSRHVDNEFRMPELTSEDWYTIFNNVCIISFMQGMPCGTTVHNDYIILPSTENKQYVNQNDIYYIGYENSVDEERDVNSSYTYHRIGCPYLKGNVIVRI